MVLIPRGQYQIMVPVDDKFGPGQVDPGVD